MAVNCKDTLQSIFEVYNVTIMWALWAQTAKLNHSKVPEECIKIIVEISSPSHNQNYACSENINYSVSLRTTGAPTKLKNQNGKTAVDAAKEQGSHLFILGLNWMLGGLVAILNMPALCGCDH